MTICIDTIISHAFDSMMSKIDPEAVHHLAATIAFDSKKLANSVDYEKAKYAYDKLMEKDAKKKTIQRTPRVRAKQTSDIRQVAYS